MREPSVSFVLPVYNVHDHLVAAVESLLAQTYSDFEIVAINDGSTDDSREILATFKDDRLRILDQPNRGLIATLNRGIKEARAPWVARMDSDDVSLPCRLELQMRHLTAHPELALLGGFVSTIDEESRVLADVVPFPQTHEELWQSIGRRPWVMCHPAVIFRRDAAIDVGLYNAAYRHAEDAEFFARMMTRYRAENLPEVVLKYRLRRAAVSSEFKDHGRVNAQLVRKIIDRWQPGEAFTATPAERAAADATIAASVRKIGPRDAASTYFCRCGRELLRGARWGSAIKAYLHAIAGTPLRYEAYRGLAAAILRAGAAPDELRRKAMAAGIAATAGGC